MHTVRLALEAMATRFELVMHGPDVGRLRAAGEEALAYIELLDRQLSAYRPDSDVSRINTRASDEPVKVEPRLFDLLCKARELHRLTDGAFDITIRPLLRAWGFVRGSGSLPKNDELAAARALVGMDNLVLDRAKLTVRFSKRGMQIDLGAIGKGYAIQTAVESVHENGVESALIHGGTSSIHAIGSPPDQPAWNIAIRAAGHCGEHVGMNVHAVALHNQALSVSAVHGKSFDSDGRTYGHVVDPRTGEAIEGNGFAVVIGPEATVCDALSTALLILGPAWLPTLKQRFPGYCGIT